MAGQQLNSAAMLGWGLAIILERAGLKDLYRTFNLSFLSLSGFRLTPCGQNDDSSVAFVNAKQSHD